jgi:hypothetical protein
MKTWFNILGWYVIVYGMMNVLGTPAFIMQTSRLGTFETTFLTVLAMPVVVLGVLAIGSLEKWK